MHGFLWRWIERWSRLLDDPAERQVVLGDLQERGVANFHALLDIGGLVLLRQVRTWCSLRPWLATVSLSLPVCAVVSPAFSVASIASRYPWPSNSQTDLQILSITFWGGVGTLILAWAAGFTLGHLTRYSALSVLAVLTTIAVLASLDDMRKATALQMLVVLLVVVPGACGLRRGFRRATLQPRSAIGLGVLGAVTVGFLIAGPGVAFDVRWSDCITLTAIWPALYALIAPTIHVRAIIVGR